MIVNVAAVPSVTLARYPLSIVTLWQRWTFCPWAVVVVDGDARRGWGAYGIACSDLYLRGYHAGFFSYIIVICCYCQCGGGLVGVDGDCCVRCTADDIFRLADVHTHGQVGCGCRRRCDCECRSRAFGDG